MRNMNAVEMKRNCIDCGREFTISPYQQMYYANRGWELPRRCRACSEKKRQERQKKEAEGATGQFEKELSDSPYAIKEVSNIEVKSPVTTLYVIGNGFDLAHGVHHPILSSEIGWENTVIFEKHWRRTSKMMHCGGI